jgi:hypothetical protein
MPSLEMVSRREEEGGEYEWLGIEDVDEVKRFSGLKDEQNKEEEEEEGSFRGREEEKEEEEEEGSFKGREEVEEEEDSFEGWEEEKEEENGGDKGFSSWSKSWTSSAGV